MENCGQLSSPTALNWKIVQIVLNFYLCDCLTFEHISKTQRVLILVCKFSLCDYFCHFFHYKGQFTVNIVGSKNHELSFHESGVSSYMHMLF